MASNLATWAAFGSIAKRSLTTHTPTRSCPYRFAHHQQTFLSTSPRHGRNLPKNHFTSNCILSHDETNSNELKNEKDEKPIKRKATRNQVASTSLRRVAVEAQTSRKVIQGKGQRAHVNPEIETKDVTAYCAAETYDINVARKVLKEEGYMPDPFHTDLFPQVLHVQTPNYTIKDEATGEERLQGAGDVFVFPSGSVVTWNVRERLAHNIVEKILPRAAVNGHADKLEAEDLEYIEDPSREHSKIIGDTIILGTKTAFSPADCEPSASVLGAEEIQQKAEVDAILTKIAFSSALARSTKLAVLENMLNAYFESTRSIPSTLSAGTKLPFNRKFILQKTGQLLSIRAQLNLYSELTDSLPDLFWDSPYELGLESYYEQVGRALDIGSRIKILNERMDYASEIAAVLRERLSEKHSTELEWLIIGLIAIEVLFEIRKLWEEWRDWVDPENTEAMMRKWLARELQKPQKAYEASDAE
ncbi:hypothetical protein M433DRAFT_151615 [Acidomyces richmondensis BFW]|nr:MAG: hypothetical protein FE78DRAFT_85732 [Acidomyces sp. 'richmondensis']KYG47949.1 hypothetical protein M433DRAFT_151615 [Acidomyces richmondensis BFW]